MRCRMNSILRLSEGAVRTGHHRKFSHYFELPVGKGGDDEEDENDQNE